MGAALGGRLVTLQWDNYQPVPWAMVRSLNGLEKAVNKLKGLLRFFVQGVPILHPFLDETFDEMGLLHNGRFDGLEFGTIEVGLLVVNVRVTLASRVYVVNLPM